MNLIFLGAPGAGKGTQAEIISKKLQIPTISTGNMLREAVLKQTPQGVSAKGFMDKGDLVPDSVVIGILKDRISEDDAQNGFILDGFPRTVPQAQALLDMGVKIDYVVEIAVPDEAIVKRMSGRRVCEKCGNSYHITSKPTKVEGVCDSCSGKVVTRVDDAPETVLSRLQTYYQKTAPLKDFYAEKGCLCSVDGQKDINVIAEDILTAIKA